MTDRLFWKAYGEGCALSRGCVCLYSTAAQFDNTVNNCKTQPVSFAFSGGVALIEFVENMFGSFRIHADTCVADNGFDYIRLCQLNGDGTAFRCEFDCVGQQIQPHLHKQFIVSVIDYIFQPDIQFQIFFAPIRFQQ